MGDTQAALERCQRQAEEVTELMRDNVTRALEREGRLQELDTRAQDLHAMSSTFARTTRGVARQQRRGHRCWRLVAIGVATGLVLLLALGLALWLSRPSPAGVTVIVTVPPAATVPAGSEAMGAGGETLQ
ncbi:vesicle-associated membrane protein 5-like [Aegotheles albertisi]